MLTKCSDLVKRSVRCSSCNRSLCFAPNNPSHGLPIVLTSQARGWPGAVSSYASLNCKILVLLFSVQLIIGSCSI